MDLTPYVSALRDDLAAAAAVGDEATSRAGSTLAAALEPAVRLALMNALSDLAGEIDTALPEHTVGLRLRGREVDVSVERRGPDGSDGHDREPEHAGAGGGFFAGPSSSPFAGPGGGHRERPAFPGGPGPGGPGPGFPGGPGGPGSGGPGFAPGGGFGEQGGPDVGDISRMTLRIVDQIKGQAEKAAAAQGMSLNSWVSQAVQGALRSYGGGERGDRGWSGWGAESGSDDRAGDGRDRPGRSQWSGGRPVDEHTPPDAGPERPSGEPGTDRAAGGSDRPGERRDDDPGDGGVQGWVRG